MQDIQTKHSDKENVQIRKYTKVEFSSMLVLAAQLGISKSSVQDIQIKYSDKEIVWIGIDMKVEFRVILILVAK